MNAISNMTMEGSNRYFWWKNFHNFLENIKTRMINANPHNKFDISIYEEEKVGNSRAVEMEVQFYDNMALNSLFMSVAFAPHIDRRKACSKLYRIFEFCMEIKALTGISIIIGVNKDRMIPNTKDENPAACGFKKCQFIDTTYLSTKKEVHAYSWDFVRAQTEFMPHGLRHFLYKIKKEYYKNTVLRYYF